MNIAVRFYTRSGNTEKLAGAIAGALGVQARAVTDKLDEKADILFLGCSYYAFDVDDAVKQFISANRDNIGKIVCFGTSAMMRSVRKPVMRALQGQNICVLEEEFHCRGQFGSFHKGRPNGDDLKKAAQFAAGLVEKQGGK